MEGLREQLPRLPVAFGRLAVPLLFAELQNPESVKKLRALASLQDLIHDPERLYQTLTGGYLEKVEVLLEDEDPSVRTKTCELLCLLCTHSLGRQVLLSSSSLLSRLFRLLDDVSSSCRKNVLKVMNLLTLHPSGADVLLTLVPKLLLRLQKPGKSKVMLEKEKKEEEILQKLQEKAEETEKFKDKKEEQEMFREEMKVMKEEEREVQRNEEKKKEEEVEEIKVEEQRNVKEEVLKETEEEQEKKMVKVEVEKEGEDIEEQNVELMEEEEEILVLTVIGCCSRRNALPALTSDAVTVLKPRLMHPHIHIRREAAAAMMALSVPAAGKHQLCEEAVLPLLVGLLHDKDVGVRTNAAGIIMNTVITTTGRLQCVDLGVISILLHLLTETPPTTLMEEERRKRKALLLYSIRALTSLAEVPKGRRLLMEQLPVLRLRCEEEDADITRAARTAIRVVTWTP